MTWKGCMARTDWLERIGIAFLAAIFALILPVAVWQTIRMRRKKRGSENPVLATMEKPGPGGQ